MVPQSPPQEDLRQEAASQEVRVRPVQTGGRPYPSDRTRNESVPERREQLEKLLGTSEAELLQRLGRKIAPLDQIAPNAVGLCPATAGSCLVTVATTPRNP